MLKNKACLKVTTAAAAQELIRSTTVAVGVTSKKQQLKLDIKTAAAVQQLLKKKGTSLVSLPDSPSARSVYPLKKRPLINSSDLVIDSRVTAAAVINSIDKDAKGKK